MLRIQIYRLRSRGFIDYTWVGWPGIFPNDEEEKNKIIKLLEEKKCYPIWFERDELERFNVYIEKYMRPLFHNFQGTADDEFELEMSALWLTYVDVNARFVKTCVEIRKANQMIWIHDFHLLLAPLYLRKKYINTNIGFFMHSPFPSSDLFKNHQWRVEILKSLLCCGLIGFHLFEYARNFKNSCRRIL